MDENSWPLAVYTLLNFILQVKLFSVPGIATKSKRLVRVRQRVRSPHQTLGIAGESVVRPAAGRRDAMAITTGSWPCVPGAKHQQQYWDLELGFHAGAPSDPCSPITAVLAATTKLPHAAGRYISAAKGNQRRDFNVGTLFRWGR